MNPQFNPPLLYSFRRCPYAIRARLAIVYSGIPVELREVVLRDKPASLRAYSAKATVPVLVLSEQQVIDESLDIIDFCLSLNDPAGWLSDLSRSQQLEARALIKENDGFFKDHLDRYKYPDRQSDTENNGSDDRDLAMIFLAKLDQRLGKSAYLMGEKSSIADIAIFPFVRQFAFVDKSWFDQTALQYLKRWLEQWLQSPLFEQVMKKYPAWMSGDELTVFP